MRIRHLLVLACALTLAACGDDASPATDPERPTTSATPAIAGQGGESTGDADEVASAGDISPWPDDLGGDRREWTVRVIERIPHDPDAFTQGLELDRTAPGEPILLEGTGRRGESTLRRLDTDGTTLNSVDLDPAFFGEGLTVIDDEIVQLTLDAGIALRYDRTTLELIGSHTYNGAGWGLCHADDVIWMSNGSPVLTRRNPVDFAPAEAVEVTLDGEPVDDLNELECVGSHVVANVWKSDEILVIDPTTGVVDATIDAGALSAEIGATDDQAVLNGIADLGDGTLLLGGKLWPTFFVVEVVTG